MNVRRARRGCSHEATEVAGSILLRGVVSRCFMTAVRHRLGDCKTSAPVVWARLARASSNARRVGSARAFQTRSICFASYMSPYGDITVEARQGVGLRGPHLVDSQEAETDPKTVQGDAQLRRRLHVINPMGSLTASASAAVRSAVGLSLCGCHRPCDQQPYGQRVHHGKH